MAMDDRLDALGLIRLTEDECWAVLAAHNIGRLALVQRGRPLVFPVNFALDGRSVVFRTAPGTKLAAAVRNQEVAFEVDEVDSLFETGTSVMIHGQATVVPEADREQLADLRLRPWAPGERDEFVRVTPRWVSGRRIRPHHDDDGLGADAG